ncbi:MBL fold hydrolase [Sulfolobales archaeon HS-7]|nr:MBL fold hydrolase [Sulfolobales archaeon HS-7]
MVKRIITGPLHTNTYVIEGVDKVIVIDPAEPLFFDKETIIVSTHGHFDHVMGVTDMRYKEFLMSDDYEAFETSRGWALENLGINVKDIPKPTRVLNEGDEISVNEVKLKVISTPGHTKGSICLLGEGYVFTGDTLFAGTIGKVWESEMVEKMAHSLWKLKSLPDNTMIYPGHGGPSTIGMEKQQNPYLNGEL